MKGTAFLRSFHKAQKKSINKIRKLRVFIMYLHVATTSLPKICVHYS